MLRWSNELGPIYLLKLYWERIVVVTDPAITTNLLKYTPDGDKSDGYGILNKGSFPEIAAAGHEVVEVLRALASGTAVDIDELLQRQALDVISRVGFGIDLAAMQGFMKPGNAQQDLLYHLKRGMDEVNMRWGDPLRGYLIFLPSVREGERHFAGFRAHMERLLALLKAKGPPAESDMSIGAHLLRLKDPHTGQPLSDDRLLPEIATLFVAGHDTAAHTMAWTLYLISQRPEVEARVCEELRSLGLLAGEGSPSPARPVQLEDLGKLTYLSACIKESMRLYPVAADGTIRVFPQPVQLGPYTVPADTMIWFYFYATHKGSQFWAEPEQFIPERWLKPGTEYHSSQPLGKEPAAPAAPSNEGQPDVADAAAAWNVDDSSSGGKRDQAALRWLPFGVGPRDCIGQSLARLNYTATLGTLLGHFSFKLAPEMEGPGGIAESDILCLTLQPANGLKMFAVPRA
ncbi:hypothetical protein N2152v2_003110 [Parachlorella kessleri]